MNNLTTKTHAYHVGYFIKTGNRIQLRLPASIREAVMVLSDPAEIAGLTYNGQSYADFSRLTNAISEGPQKTLIYLERS